MEKSFFVDTTRCTACRGCQIACKQWHDHPAEKTTQTGTYQNPPDTSFIMYRLIRFNEHIVDGKLRWLFFQDQCRHCVAAPCKAVADAYVEGAIIREEATQAVLYTALTAKLSAEERQEVVENCPYNIPRVDEATGMLGKCDMCIDRVLNGKKPACVLSCPTGTMNFGDRDEMLALADERLKKVQKRTPGAQLLDVDYVNTIYLVEFDPKLYHEYAQAYASAGPPVDRRHLLAALSGRERPHSRPRS